MPRLTVPQLRLLRAIARAEPYAEYWPVVNDWSRATAGPDLAFFNQNRTIGVLRRRGYITLDDAGLFHLTAAGVAAVEPER